MNIKATFAEPGSISHGTLRHEDLIPAFVSYLRSMAEHNNDEERWKLLLDEAEKAFSDDAETNELNPDETSEMLDDLSDALEVYAPPGHYFGAHEGDGSDFGFWPTAEHLEQEELREYIRKYNLNNDEKIDTDLAVWRDVGVVTAEQLNDYLEPCLPT